MFHLWGLLFFPQVCNSVSVLKFIHSYEILDSAYVIS